MTPLVLQGLGAAIQDEIAAESGLGYEVGVNFTLEDSADIQDLELLASAAGPVLVTMYDEGGTLLPSARRTPAERSFRFATKGSHAQEALDRSHGLLSWLWNHKSFARDGFRIWVLRVPGFPQVAVRGASGSHVAEFVVTFRACNT